jgi:tetrahydromethanopterin S-methyltransferase subunit B
MDLNSIIISMTNKTPCQEKIERIEQVRDKYKKAAAAMVLNCCPGREFEVSVQMLETALMWAIKSIILEEE